MKLLTGIIAIIVWAVLYIHLSQNDDKYSPFTQLLIIFVFIGFFGFIVTECA